MNGKSITLNNDEVYKRSSLLIVPTSKIYNIRWKNIIVKINKQIKEERFLKSEGVDVSNILETIDIFDASCIELLATLEVV